MTDRERERWGRILEDRYLWQPMVTGRIGEMAVGHPPFAQADLEYMIETMDIAANMISAEEMAVMPKGCPRPELYYADEGRTFAAYFGAYLKRSYESQSLICNLVVEMNRPDVSEGEWTTAFATLFDTLFPDEAFRAKTEGTEKAS